MATMKVEEILRDTRAFVESKRASAAGEKQALAGQDPNTLPGSEHDSKVKEEAKKMQPEVTEGSPSGAFSASGAKPGDKVEMASALDATQAPPAKVDKEPLITSDINVAPKTGAALANDLLASIKRAQDELSKKAAAPAAAPAPEKKAADDKKPAGSKGGDISEAQAVDASKGAPPVVKESSEPKKEDMPADGKAAPKKDKDTAETGGSMPCKGGAAPLSALELTQDVLAKIASTLLATEEGWTIVHDGLSKAAGAEAARQTMDFLKNAAEQVQAEQAAAQGYADADNLIKRAIYLKGVEDAQKDAAAKAKPAKPAAAKPAAKATAEQAHYAAGYKVALLQKVAAQRQAKAAGTGAEPTLIQKLAIAIAEASAKQADGEEEKQDEGGEAAGEDAGAAGGEAGMEGADAGPEAAPEGGSPLDEMGGAPQDQEISPEELQQALAALVQEGQLTPEAAQQIMQYVSSADSVGQAAGAAEGAEGGAIPPEMAAAMGGGLPPELAGGAPAAGPGAAMEATASAEESAGTLLAAIEKIRQARK